MKKTIAEAKTERSLALDSLRGLAILLMVLSGSIAFGDILPAWMYHAQVPPPNHIFNPNLPGITWVDLVFPFFLFAMGIAFPFALNKKLDEKGLVKTIAGIFQRYALLIFFAIFSYDARAWVMDKSFGLIENLLSIICFVLLFFMLAKTKFETKRIEIFRKIVGFLLAILFLIYYPFQDKGFDIYKSDIIIVVLANMALFGSLIWIFTKNKPIFRLGILPFIMAVFLSGKIDGSWQKNFYDASPIPWAYTFYYLKYLFIVIPGTFAGDWLLKAQYTTINKGNKNFLLLSVSPLLLVALNVALLFGRYLELNLIITVLISICLIYLSQKTSLSSTYHQLLSAGIYLLLLGLFFEAYEGGIKKDFSTYSYYFVSSGLAFCTIYSFLLLENLRILKSVFSFLSGVGKNPMIAYTAGNLLLLPLMRITKFENVFNQLNQSMFGGFAKGILFTGIVALITLFFTKRRIFWKT